MPARAEETAHPVQERVRVGDDLQDRDAQGAVERLREARQVAGEIGLLEIDRQGPGSDLGAGPLQHGRRVVETGDLEAALGQQAAVVSRSTTQIDHATAGGQRSGQPLDELDAVGLDLGVGADLVPPSAVGIPESPCDPAADTGHTLNLATRQPGTSFGCSAYSRTPP